VKPRAEPCVSGQCHTIKTPPAGRFPKWIRQNYFWSLTIHDRGLYMSFRLGRVGSVRFFSGTLAATGWFSGLVLRNASASIVRSWSLVCLSKRM
jgi:hypothetical protein